LSDLHLSGRIYDWGLEPILKGIKRRVSRYILKHNLFPVLDLCCGTGTQCNLIDTESRLVSGVDKDIEMVRYASLKYPHILFICADAASLPLRGNSLNGVVLSYAVHDKSLEMRHKILKEIKRLLTPEGKIVIVDFEKPWNKRSRIGGFLTFLIERMAGRAHFRNGRQFLSQGGLRAFLEMNGLVEIERHNFELGNSSIVVAQFV
jgi:demethylmenaquinone methyltransferase/2-methoxy-6-polyprenyl-1,4-benzoquinol methylase